MSRVTNYDKQKVLEHIMSELDLTYVTRFTDETVIDAGDFIARRFVTIELLVPEPKQETYGFAANGPATAIIVHQSQAIVKY